MPETAVSCESGTFPRVQKCSDACPLHRMTQTIGEDQVVVGVLTHRGLPWRAPAPFHALSWWATVARIKTLPMLDSVLGFSERTCSCCASSSAGRGRGHLLLKRLHGRLVDTLELFSIMMDAVPARCFSEKYRHSPMSDQEFQRFTYCMQRTG